MSLILDALKKSEEERRRGQPPGLHSPLHLPRRPHRRVQVWAARAGAVVLCAGLAGIWWVQGRPGELGSTPALAEAGGDAADAGTGTHESMAPEPDAAFAQETAAPVAVALTAPALPERFATMPGTSERESLPMSPEQGAAALGGVDALRPAQRVSGGGAGVPDRSLNFTPTVVVLVPPQDGLTPGVPAPPAETVARQDPKPAPVAAAETVMPAVSTPVASAMAAPSPPAPAQPAPGPVVVDVPSPVVAAPAPPPAPVADPEVHGSTLPAIHELAYATRRELPKLDLSMHVYSRLAEERFVVLNGKRYTQAMPALGPDLNLVDIVAEGVVLEFRGQRFLLPRQTF
jgi:general secretion pathway protein B